MHNQTDVFDLQGHRGCRGLMPENTIPAMLHAVDLGVNTLEMDLVITKDSQVILSHEPWMNAEITTKPGGQTISEAEAPLLNMYKMNYAEVLQYDVGSKFHPRFPEQKKMKVQKPLLDDVFSTVEAYTIKNKLSPVYYNIETKSTKEGDGIYHPLPRAFIDILLPVIKKHQIQNRVIIQSFDVRTLQYLHNIDPAIKTSLLIDETDKRSLSESLKELGFIPSILSPHYSLVDKQLVNDCHAQGMRLIPWTVNELNQMKSLRKLGVDGIISDYPNLYKQL